MQIWLANHDNDVEGEWRNWYTAEVGLYFSNTKIPFKAVFEKKTLSGECGIVVEVVNILSSKLPAPNRVFGNFVHLKLV